MDGDVVVEDHDLQRPAAAVGADVKHPVAFGLVNHVGGIAYCVVDVVVSDAVPTSVIGDLH